VLENKYFNCTHPDEKGRGIFDLFFDLQGIYEILYFDGRWDLFRQHCAYTLSGVSAYFSGS
jgi:hypothetical protein